MEIGRIFLGLRCLEKVEQGLKPKSFAHPSCFHSFPICESSSMGLERGWAPATVPACKELLLVKESFLFAFLSETVPLFFSGPN